MNKVFPSQIRKAHGVLSFSKAERQVLAAAVATALLAAVAVHLFLAIAVFVAVAAAVLVHRRVDNHRMDHLEILGRRLAGGPVWSLCERDFKYVSFEHGKKP